MKPQYTGAGAVGRLFLFTLLISFTTGTAVAAAAVFASDLIGCAVAFILLPLNFLVSFVLAALFTGALMRFTS